MSSIRPLVTITILIVVGAYLYVKINEGPVPPAITSAEPWHSEAGVPPLASTAAAPATSSSAAPSWPAANTSAPSLSATPSNTPPVDHNAGAVGSDQSAPAIADVATVAETLPTVPAIPELPPVATADTSPATAAASPPLPSGLPANIPTARYPDEPVATGLATTSDPPGSQSLAPAPAPAPAPGSDALWQGQPTTNAITEATPPAWSELPTAQEIPTSAVPGPEAPLSQNPLRQPAQPEAAPGRYSPDAVNPSQLTAETRTPVEGSFATSWPEIQTALDRGQLANAHQLLSKWYDEPSLTPAEAEKVETLLSQLAGTVVYSTEHQLEPAHVVKPGETLETIAKAHNVPWQLLAKINGIPAADQLRPGQELKVVPGPFSAIVDLRRNHLTLMVDGRYAGKFPVAVPVAAGVSEGQWLVDQKLVTPRAAGVTQSAYTTAPAAVDRSIVLRGESSPGQQAGGPTLTIASGVPPSGATSGSPTIQVAPADAEELSDILSIGSRVVIRR